MPSLDFDALRTQLEERWGPMREEDLLSAALYPQVFREYREFREQYADVSVLPTRNFLAALAPGEEIDFEIERGKTLVVKFIAVGELDTEGHRPVFFELNGQARTIKIADASAEAEQEVREKADLAQPEQLAAPMPGAVVEVRVGPGDEVAVGDPVVVLSAMKMETVVGAVHAGKVRRLAVEVGAQVEAGDLVAVIDRNED